MKKRSKKGFRVVLKTQHSKLVFLMPREGPLDFTKVIRAREPAKRSGQCAKIGDPRHKRSIHTEYEPEFLAVSVLLATAAADVCQEQPCILGCTWQGEKRRYIPDILVIWGSRRLIIEIKEDAEAESEENRVWFAYVRELFADYGFEFRVWKRSEFTEEPRFKNAREVLRYRTTLVSVSERERIRRAFRTVSEMSIRELCKLTRVGAQVALHLVYDGMLHIDWWVPLDLDSTISIVPIGRQAFPFPGGGDSEELAAA